MLAQNRLRLLLGISIVVILLFVLLVVILSYRYKRKKLKLADLAFREREEKLKQEEISILQKQHMKEYEARIQGQDMAREQIARELHDQVANSLAALKLKVESTGRMAQSPDMQNLSAMIDGVYHHVRNLSHAMHIPDLEKRPLTILLNDFIHDFQKVSDSSVSWSVFPEDSVNELDISIRKSLFLIIQELFMNAARYAKATLINLTLNLHSDELVLILEDNGYGFDKEGLKGNGLINMEWRVKKLNGVVEVETNSYIGTCINIRIPLYQQQ